MSVRKLDVEKYMLRLEPQDKKHTAFWIVDDIFTIGKSAKNQMQLSYEALLPIHAHVKTINNHLYIEPAAADAAIHVNTKHIESPTEIKVGDMIALAGLNIQLVDLTTRRATKASPLQTETQQSKNTSQVTNATQEAAWQIQAVHTLKASASEAGAHIFAITDEKPLTVGRDDINDIKVDATHVSRRHAEFFLRNEQLIVNDFGSANGTYVNGEKIKERAVYLGDEIRFDNVIYRVIKGKVATLIDDNEQNIDKTAFRPALTAEHLQHSDMAIATNEFLTLSDFDLDTTEETRIVEKSSSHVHDATQPDMSQSETYHAPSHTQQALYSEDDDQHTVNDFEDSEVLRVEHYGLIMKVLMMLILCVVIAIVTVVFFR